MIPLVLGIIVALLLTVGLFGIFIPGVPGLGFIFGGILLFGLFTGFTTISVVTVVLLGIVTFLAALTDWFGALVGARIGGGGRWTILGMVIGGFLGLFSSGPVGLVIGIFLGALVGALKEGKSPEKASKAALFAVIGVVGATFVQAVVGVSLIVAFVLVLLF